MLQSDGWYLVAQRGSHRQFKHHSKSGHMRYAIVIEQAKGNYSAYVPDLPGCVATGATVTEVEAEIRQAIALHLEGIREDGQTIPQPSSQVDYVEVVA
jgi:predicted RNase H-like HicB family nuclease